MSTDVRDEGVSRGFPGASDWALLTREHERTNGGGRTRSSARRASVLVGSASADREIAKARPEPKTAEAPVRPTGPARPATIQGLSVGSPHVRRTEPSRKPTTTNAPNPPRIQGVPANGAFRGFPFLSALRDSALAPTPHPHTRPDSATARPTPPPFVLSCFRVRSSSPARPSGAASCAEIFRQVS